MDDTISRQTSVDAVQAIDPLATLPDGDVVVRMSAVEDVLYHLPSVQSTLYGYNIEHLDLIARVMQKENLPPERVTEALMNMVSIVAMVCDEFEEILKRTVEQQCGGR